MGSKVVKKEGKNEERKWGVASPETPFGSERQSMALEMKIEGQRKE